MTAARRPLLAAHRGGALLWPENGLTAYRGALALGVDFVETDVHLTAADELVLLHDPTLDRTTTGRGAVRAATRAALGEVRLRASDGSATDEPIPTLDALLDLLQPTAVGLLLEIKAPAAGARYPAIEEGVLAALRGHGLAERTVVMAFEAPTVARVRELAPAQPTAMLFRRREGWLRAPAEAVERARALGAVYLGLDHHVIDERLTAEARAAGLGLLAWVVNEPRDLARMAELGVEIVESDRPDVARRALG